jgi:hypothetical protein
MKNKEVYGSYNTKLSGSYHRGWQLATAFFDEYLKMRVNLS